jgi:hypothetical protein
MTTITFMLGLIALSGPPEAAADVQGRDLGTRLRVIGSLGLPVGERVRIRGRWRSPHGRLPSKDSSPLLHVTEVNGMQLEKEVVFPEPFVRAAKESGHLTPRSGESWEAEGYEVGRFQGTPGWALREIYGEHVPNAGVYLSGFKFILEFVYVSVRSEKESPNSK